MQRSLSIVLILAACSQTPSVDLPVCATGVEIEAGLKHSMVIDAAGRVTIDGVACPSEEEAQKALERVAKSMHSNETVAAQTGWAFAADEPLIVRIDQSVRFGDAQHWLRESRYCCGIYRSRIVVRDELRGRERCLAIDTEPPPQTSDGPPPPCDSATDKLSGRVCIWLKSGDVPWWNERGHAPAWYVRQNPTPCDCVLWEASSWNEVRDRVDRIPPNGREFGIDAVIGMETPWRDVVAIVAEAQALLHAEIEFY